MVKTIAAVSLLSCLVAAYALVFVAFAQGTELGGGSASFEVRPIILEDIPLEAGDYCGNPAFPQTLNEKLGLSTSDEDFLNIRWNAQDPNGLERQIGIQCWLNCPVTNHDQIVNSTSFCDGYQMCSFLGPTGPHACSVQDPTYNSTDNVVHCRFYDQIDENTGLDVQNRTFKTFDYEISTPPVTLTVGVPTVLPIVVKSFGLIETSYTNNISALTQTFLVNVQNPVSVSDTAFCGETVETFPSLMFLSAQEIPFSILSHGSADVETCTVDPDCAYLGPDARCVNNLCWGRVDINIDAGVASLSEYHFPGFVFILLTASGLFFLSRRKMF